MSEDRPIAELPERLCFTLPEVAELLFTADTAVDLAASASAEHRMARAVQRLITARLWPDLGELLDDDDGEGG